MRLWLWSAIIIVTIYSTLGLARTCADALGKTPLGGGLFLIGCILFVIVVIVLGLNKKPEGKELGIAFGILAVYLLVFSRMTVDAERSHLIEYGK